MAGGPSYDRFAPVYDLLADVWSGGAIAAAARAASSGWTSGSRILVAGGGTGRDAVAYAQAGADVTIVDLSARMLLRAAVRAARAGVDVRVIQGDAREVAAPGEGFDVVCAPYFLNLFGEPEATATLVRLRELARPGGAVVIADFAPLAGPWPLRLAQAAHFALPMWTFAALGLCARHPIHDHERMVLRAGLSLESVVDHRVARIGPRWHRTWTARKGVIG